MKMLKSVDVMLNEEDFKCLIRGGILRIKRGKFKTTLNLALSDIGYGSMYSAINKAEDNPKENFMGRERDLIQS